MANPTDPSALEVTYKSLGGTRIRLHVKWTGGSYTDSFDVTNAIARTKSINKLTSHHPALERCVIEAELDKIAETLATRAMKDDEESEQLGGTDDVILIEIATNKDRCELFHEGARHDATPYARILVEDHWENWPVHSAAYRNWLRHQFYVRFDRSPSAQDFTDALNTITAKALYEGESTKVYVRSAALGDKTVLDLVNDEWSAIVITAHGWQIVDSANVPVRFTRKRGMAALPMPERGGSLEALRRFVNVPTDDLWILTSCTLVTLALGRGPFVVILFLGEQGSAKSFSAKKLRSLVDPSTVNVRRLPKEVRDLAIAAAAAYLLSFDNVSVISPEMSDALCSLATGGGFGTRQLYTDDEERLFDAMRPVIINGIGDVATRADLLDRAMILNLPRIPEAERKLESVLDAEWEVMQRSLFGALLDATSRAMALLDKVSLQDVPRMADFSYFATAAEMAIGHPPGSFMSAYRRNRQEAVAVALESAPIYGPLRDFMESRFDAVWEGTCEGLLNLLVKPSDTQYWPKSPKGMSDALKRIAPAMRSTGLDVEFLGRKAGGKRDRLIRITRRDSPGQSSPPPDCPEKTPFPAPGEAIRDARDGWDSSFRVPGTDTTQEGSDAPVVDDTGATPKQPSQASQLSRTGPGDPAKADFAGQSQDSTTVPNRPGDDDDEVIL